MWTYITQYYEEYIEKHADPRIQKYPLMDSPKYILYIVGVYLLFIKVIGPMYMKNRPPMDIKKIIVGYNAFQSIYSFVLFLSVSLLCPVHTWTHRRHTHATIKNTVCVACEIEAPLFCGFYAMYYANKANFSYKCQIQNHSKTDYYTMQTINLSYLFLFGRFVEFLDTIFFILRKKNKQVTTLHVVHHALVPVLSWVGIKILPGGHYTFAGFINVFVHTFMYMYYMIAALGPEYKKYLWWKKYMTMLQLAQFIIVIVHTVQTLALNCPVPKIMGILILLQAVLFYKLFYDYYKEAFGTSNQETITFNLEKYYEKYRKFFEMCVPNQHLLMDDSSEGNIVPVDLNKSHTE